MVIFNHKKLKKSYLGVYNILSATTKPTRKNKLEAGKKEQVITAVAHNIGALCLS